MSSAQLSEKEPPTALPASEPKAALHASAPEPEEQKGSGVRKWIVVLIVLSAVGAAVWKIRDNKQQNDAQSAKLAAAADRPTPVLVAAVQQKTMPIYLTELGTVTAYNTVTIKSRVDGQLIRVNVREGQAVKKGQLLLEIDPAPYQAALAQAQGQLVKDQANAVNMQAEADRYKRLYDAGVVSKESQDAQVSGAGQATGSLDADRAAIQAAKVNLDYTKITSPIDGVVGLRQVDPGNIVHAADTTGLIVVTQLQPISVIFTLPEDQLPQVQSLTRSGKALTVEAYDRSETTHLASGKLLTLDNQIDTTTGTVKAKSVFDNKDNSLFPNQFVNVRLILLDRPNAIVIPSAALQTGSQGSFVYIVKPGNPPASVAGDDSVTGATTSAKHSGAGKSGGDSAAADGAGSGKKSDPYYVEAQPVKVDLTEGTQVILASGLNPGDQIVVDGQEKLRNGAKVIPRTSIPGANGAGRGGNKAATGTPSTGAAAQTPGTHATGQHGKQGPAQ